jgi:hypothetical protein
VDVNRLSNSGSEPLPLPPASYLVLLPFTQRISQKEILKSNDVLDAKTLRYFVIRYRLAEISA